MDSFLFQLLGGADAFPGARDFDQNSLARDACFFIQRDELASLGDGGFGVEAQPGCDLGGDAAGHNFKNFASKEHEKAIDEFFGHLLMTPATLQSKLSSLVDQVPIH